MPGGVHKSKRPSGFQQRKAQDAKNKSLKAQSGSLLQYVKKLNDGQGSSKESPHQSPNYETHCSNANTNAEVMEVEMAEFESEELEIKMEEIEVGKQGEENEEFARNDRRLETEKSVAQEREVEIHQEVDDSCQRDSSHGIVNEICSIQTFLSDVSSWKIPVPDSIVLEIIKMGSASFQNKDGPFGVVSRQNTKGNVRQLSKDWFYKIMSNGEKMLRSWMVFSIVSENLYCFCCRLFAVSTTRCNIKICDWVSGLVETEPKS